MGKIVSQEELVLRCRERKATGAKIAVAIGIFEFLHPGHVRLLEQARDQGDVLVVAVLNDSSVRTLIAAEPTQKNSRSRAVQRPVIPAAERMEIVAALSAVDYAVGVDLSALSELLRELAPDAVIDSAEPSSPGFVAGAVKDIGVKFVRIPFEPGHSTASIIERIVQLSGSE